MAKDTKEKLIRSSRILFSKSWYDTVSIAEICRHADLSNGVFYRYFKSKEDLFKIIIDEFLSHFKSELEAVDGEDLPSRLHSFYTTVNRICFTHPSDVSIFREGQYRFPEYEEKLRVLYMNALQKVYGRPMDEAEYLFILSGLRFLNTRSLYDEMEFPLKTVESYILKGVFPQVEPDEPQLVESGPFDSSPSDEAKMRLIKAGMDLFGKEGYDKVNVYDVARSAGLSVGAFYLYFPSKEDFLAIIIKHIGHSTRYYLSKKLVPTNNRLNFELEGMWNFVGYFTEYPQYYEIVREAEFVSRDWVKDYYDRFSKGYLHTLTHIPEIERPVMANFLMGLSHYLGIEAIFYDRIGDLKTTIRKLGKYLSRGIPE